MYFYNIRFKILIGKVSVKCHKPTQSDDKEWTYSNQRFYSPRGIKIYFSTKIFKVDPKGKCLNIGHDDWSDKSDSYFDLEQN